MSLGALKEGFKSCRKVIGIYGCKRRGSYPEILLLAMGIDSNNSIFPIAFAIVEIENGEPWR